MSVYHLPIIELGFCPFSVTKPWPDMTIWEISTCLIRNRNGYALGSSFGHSVDSIFFFFFFWCSPFISYVLWALYACLCSVPFSPIPPCLWIVYSGLPLRVSLIFICFVLVWEGASVLVDINLYSILDFPHL